MRKLLYSLLSLLLFSIIFISCMSDNPAINIDKERTDVIKLYQSASAEGAAFNRDALDALTGELTRSDSNMYIVDYLLSLSTEQIDSLYMALDAENHMQQTNLKVEMKMDSLVQIVPAEDIAKLYTFMNDYVYAGGHSVGKVEQLIESIKSPIIKKIAIKAAAYYDQIVSEKTAKSFILGTRTSRPCWLQLADDCGGLAVGAASLGMNIAADNVPMIIVDCAHEIADIVWAIHRYHRCEMLEGR